MLGETYKLFPQPFPDRNIIDAAATSHPDSINSLLYCSGVDRRAAGKLIWLLNNLACISAADESSGPHFRRHPRC